MRLNPIELVVKQKTCAFRFQAGFGNIVLLNGKKSDVFIRNATDAVGDCSAVQNLAGRRRDACEDPTDFAALLFAAIVAATVGHAAEAGQRSNRTVDDAHHFAKGDRVSTLEKHITT